MSDRPYHIQQLDHVELFVPDRYEAAGWYEKVLGLSILSDYEYWAEDPNGPLMLSPDEGNTKLALFEGGELSAQRGGFDQVAFRVDGPGFIAFVEQLDALDLYDKRGHRLSAASVRDHHGCYSLHFCDPWGHRIEITTYECEYVATHLGIAQGM